VLEVVQVQRYEGPFGQGFEDAKEALDDSAEGDKYGVDVGTASYLESEDEHEGSEDVGEGFKQVEPHLSAVDDEVSQVDVGFVLLGDGDRVVLVKLFVDVLLHLYEVDHKGERGEDREDASA